MSVRIEKLTSKLHSRIVNTKITNLNELAIARNMDPQKLLKTIGEQLGVKVFPGLSSISGERTVLEIEQALASIK